MIHIQILHYNIMNDKEKDLNIQKEDCNKGKGLK